MDNHTAGRDSNDCDSATFILLLLEVNVDNWSRGNSSWSRDREIVDIVRSVTLNDVSEIREDVCTSRLLDGLN